MRTASLVGTAVSSTSANGRGTRDASFARSSFSSAPLFFFSLSRIERCACDCASLRVGERGGIGEQKKIDSGRGARRANDRGSMRWNVNEYRRVIHSNLRLFRDRWTWDCTSRARDGLFFSLFARLYSSRENL